MAWQQSMQESVRVGPLTGNPASAQVFTLLPAASPRPQTNKEGNEWLQQREGSLVVSAQSRILQTWAPFLPWPPDMGKNAGRRDPFWKRQFLPIYHSISRSFCLNSCFTVLATVHLQRDLKTYYCSFTV